MKRPAAALLVLTMVIAGANVPASAETGPGEGGELTTVRQTRLLDKQMAAGEVATLGVLGVNGVPSTGVSAVVLNVSGTAGVLAHIDVWPTGQTKPDTPVLTIAAGFDLASNAAVVQPGGDGRVQLRSSGASHLTVDVLGYFTAVAGDQPAPGGLITVEPTPVLDTRTGVGTGGVIGKIPGLGTIDVKANGLGAIPADALAVFANVTVVDPAKAGNLQIYPTDVARPTTPTMGFTDSTTSQGIPVKVGADGKIKVHNHTNTGPVDVRIDVTGYFAAGAGAGGGFTPANQIRLFDSRVDRPTPLAANETVAVEVGGMSGVADVPGAVVAVNISTLDATAAGALKVWRDDYAEPAAAAITPVPGAISRNLALVPMSADGTIAIKNVSAGTLNVLVDLQGWFSVAYRPDPQVRHIAVNAATSLESAIAAAEAAGAQVQQVVTSAVDGEDEQVVGYTVDAEDQGLIAQRVRESLPVTLDEYLDDAATPQPAQVSRVERVQQAAASPDLALRSDAAEARELDGDRGGSELVTPPNMTTVNALRAGTFANLQLQVNGGDIAALRRIGVVTTPADAAPETPAEAGTAAACSSYWYPFDKSVLTGKSSYRWHGREMRFGSSRIRWGAAGLRNLKCFGSRTTYENEILVHNYDGKHYLRKQIKAWTSTLPYKYRDSQLFDGNGIFNLTIGTSHATALKQWKWYRTYVRTIAGNVTSDRGRFQGQRGHRSPSWCHSPTFCIWADATRRFTSSWTLRMPGYWADY
ncbi:hypothetical protein [Kibdelosporangium aridum]|uniref:hypothetical protein n=1 Tax=Kibdelosporangium aridum TaxID=2030 RepID=UPI000524A23C